MAWNNQISIKGNVGNDPEIKFTTTNMKVANFSVAVSRGRKEDNKPPIWFNCVAFDRQADVVESHVHKGYPVRVSGTMVCETWENNEGKTQYFWKLYMDDITKALFATDKNASGAVSVQNRAPAAIKNNNIDPPQKNGGGSQQGFGSGFQNNQSNDDIPF